MSQIPNEVVAMLRNSGSDFAKATPDSGQGWQGEWPPEGEHDLLVKSLHAAIGELTDGKPGDGLGNGVKHKCVLLQFEYEVLPNRTNPAVDPSQPGLVFKGTQFRYLPSFESVIKTEGARKGAKITLDRLLNHLVVLSGKSADEVKANVMGAVEAIQSKITSGSTLAVSAVVQYRPWESKGKKGIEKMEHLRSLLSA